MYDGLGVAVRPERAGLKGTRHSFLPALLLELPSGMYCINTKKLPKHLYNLAGLTFKSETQNNF